MEKTRKKLATSVLNVMYALLDRDIDLSALEEAEIYAEHILCSTDNLITILEWLGSKNLKPQVSKCLCENIYLCVEFKKDYMTQKTTISDIRAFFKNDDENDVEISVEAAMRQYLEIDCFSNV